MYNYNYLVHSCCWINFCWMNEKNYQEFAKNECVIQKWHLSWTPYVCSLIFPSEELRQASIARPFVSVFFHSEIVSFSLVPISQLPCKIVEKVNKHLKMHIAYCDIVYLCTQHPFIGQVVGIQTVSTQFHFTLTVLLFCSNNSYNNSWQFWRAYLCL